MTLGLDLSLMQSGGGLLGNSTAVGAILDQLQAESNGLAFDFLQDDPQLLIRDEKTAANLYLGSFNGKVAGAWAAPKVIGQIDDRELVTNRTGAGAVPGTPGTNPTNWNTGSTGLTKTVVGTGVDANGVSYVDFRFNGTISAGNGINIDPISGLAAVTGQRFRNSMQIALVAGSFANISSVNLTVREGDSVGTLVTPGASNAHSSGNIQSQITSTLQTFSADLETTGGLTTRQVSQRFAAFSSGGGAVDFTIRIGLPSFKRLDVVYDHAPHNYHTNSAGTGAANPSTLPTTWSETVPSGITRTVVGSGVENGVEYVEFRIQGTPASGGHAYQLRFGAVTVASVPGHIWTNSAYLSLVGGTLTNVNTVNLSNDQFSAGPVFLARLIGTDRKASLTSSLRRFSDTSTIANASTTIASPILEFPWTSGAVDFTFRVGWPQYERRAWAGTPVRTTNAARFPVISEWFTSRNEIRNSVAAGAVAGSPGTFPTNWVVANSAGCSWSVIGTGTQNGIEFIDVRLQGTAGSGGPSIAFESTTQIVASSGQSWASTFFCYLVSGTLTGISNTQNLISEGDAGGTLVTTNNTVFTANDTTLLSAARRTHIVASTNASTARIRNSFILTEAASGAVDATFRIALPQLERQSFATDPIRTTGLAANGNTRLGVPIEGARTNEIRNNTMQGAVAGSPGTIPTTWQVGGGAGLTRTIATGTIDGQPFIDYRFNGTTGDANGIQLDLSQFTTITAATGQAWALSVGLALVGGSLANITSILPVIREGTSASVLVLSNNGSDIKQSLGANIRRFAYSVTLSGGATTERVTPRIQVSYSNGVAVDFTLRIMLPNFEQTSVPSITPIRTFNAAVTRPTDAPELGVANFPSMQNGGHMLTEWLPGRVNGFSSPLTLRQDASNFTSITQDTVFGNALNTVAAVPSPGFTPINPLAVLRNARMAFSFAANNYKAAGNGGAISSGVVGATLPTYGVLRFGYSTSGVNDYLHGYLRRGRVVPRTLTDAETVALSRLAA